MRATRRRDPRNRPIHPATAASPKTPGPRAFCAEKWRGSVAHVDGADGRDSWLPDADPFLPHAGFSNTSRGSGRRLVRRGEDLSRHVHAVDGAGETAVDHQRQHHLFDLFPRDAVVECSLQVDFEFLHQRERREHGDHHQAAVATRKLRPRPHVAKGEVEHEAAHFTQLIDRRRLGKLHVHIGLAEQGVQHVEPVGAALLVVL
ncbi:MAG: hypothetical protein CL938_12020 [Deltaproteobacteria bacterium]|nr:hypothetical protein [Deltaproteobacteria bacterium]